MAIVAGVDFGTLSVRVSLVDSERGLIQSAIAEYPLHRKREDPEYATQSHDDQMRALTAATREALRKAGIHGDQVQAIALDTTGSSVIPVGKNMHPLGEYYLWCDHRAKGEAAEITEIAHREGLEAIQWCGGVYSSEWGFSKLRHGTQVAVESSTGRPSAGELSRKSRSPVAGRPRKAGWRVCHLRSDRWDAVGILGRKAGVKIWDSDPGWSIRCALGRHRRGL